MLVLSFLRRRSVVIGNEILLSVTKVNAGRIKIGLQGPVNFHRSECLPDGAPTGSPSKDGLLILDREIGEKIVIGDLGTVKVLRVQGKRVKLGFEFPRELSVKRRSVFEQQFGAFTRYREPWDREAA